MVRDGKLLFTVVWLYTEFSLINPESPQFVNSCTSFHKTKTHKQSLWAHLIATTKCGCKTRQKPNMQVNKITNKQKNNIVVYIVNRSISYSVKQIFKFHYLLLSGGKYGIMADLM